MSPSACLIISLMLTQSCTQLYRCGATGAGAGGGVEAAAVAGAQHDRRAAARGGAPRPRVQSRGEREARVGLGMQPLVVMQVIRRSRSADTDGSPALEPCSLHSRRQSCGWRPQPCAWQRKRTVCTDNIHHASAGPPLLPAGGRSHPAPAGRARKCGVAADRSAADARVPARWGSVSLLAELPLSEMTTTATAGILRCRRPGRHAAAEWPQPVLPLGMEPACCLIC